MNPVAEEAQREAITAWNTGLSRAYQAREDDIHRVSSHDLLCAGFLLYLGLGTPGGVQDKTGAIDAFRLATLPQPGVARSTQSEAMYMLGTAQYYGIGIQEDEISAVSWLTQASEEGHAEATFLLSSLVSHG